jgi:WD40 repeat protein
MLWTKVLITVVIALLTVSPDRQTSSAPYVYYAGGKGFIVMRADGSDRRIIGQEIDHKSPPTWREWSPSGTWLAWMSNPYLAPDNISRAYVADAARAYTLGAFNTLDMAWSPDQDWLLFGGVQSVESNEVLLEWKVIAPGTDRPLVSAKFKGDSEQQGMLWIGRDPIVYFALGSKTNFYRLSIDKGKAEAIAEIAGRVFSASPDGYAAYLTGQTLVISNILRKETHQFSIEGTKFFEISWHGNQAVFFSDRGAWWLNLANDKSEAIYQLATGERRSNFSNAPTWGPGDYGMVGGEGGYLYLISPQGVRRMKMRGAWQWLNGNRVALYDIFNGQLAIYNINDGSQEIIYDTLKALVFSSPPQLSPDERSIASIQDGPVIVERTSGQIHRFPPHPQSWGGNWGGEIYWHPTQPWVISIEKGIAASAQIYHASLVSLGAGVFPVTDGSDDEQWLPERVDPLTFKSDKASTTSIKPVRVLKGKDWVDDLTWNQNVINAYGDQPTAWNADTGQEVSQVQPRPEKPKQDEYYKDIPVLAKTSDGKRVLTRSGEVYNTETGQVLYRIVDPNVNDLSKVQFSADGKYLVGLAGLDLDLYLWDARNGKLLYKGLYPTAFALSPDSTQIAVAQSWDVSIYRINDLR